MQYKLLGRTGVKVSALVFGTMAFGGDADDQASAALFRAAMDAGINTFDCADIYGKGRSELLLGKLIGRSRDDIVLTTKAYFPTGKGPNDWGLSRYHLVRAVEASLRRLGTDYIDVFFLHRYDSMTALDETMRAVDDLVRQGKILYPAVSNFSAWQTQKAVDMCEKYGWARPVCTQPMYSAVKRQAEVEILPMAQSEGLGVLAYGPLAGGLLTGKYGKDLRPPSGRLVSNKMYRARYSDPHYYAAAEQFVGIANKAGVHPATLAVAWARTHPAVTAPIIGARTVEQMRPLLDGADYRISDDLYQEISDMWPTPPPATDRTEEVMLIGNDVT